MGHCPLRAVSLPEPPPCPCPALPGRLFTQTQIQTQKADGAPLLFYGTAQKPELELFLISLGAEEVTTRTTTSPNSYHGNYQTSLCTLDTLFPLKEMRIGHPEIFEKQGPRQPASVSCSKKQM